MLGITFKENCPDVRNTKIVDVINALEEYGANVCVYDPWANPDEVYREYGIKPLTNLNDVQNGELNNAPHETTKNQKTKKQKNPFRRHRPGCCPQ